MANVVNKNNMWVVEQDNITISKAGSTSGSSVTLDTAGKFIDRDIVVEAPSASVADGQIAAEVSAITAGSASISTTTMATSSTATDYYVTLNTTAGSATAKAKVSTAGYVDTTDTVTSSASSVAVTGNGNKTYIKKATYINSVENPSSYTDISASAPVLIEGDYLYINEGYSPNSKISLAKLVPDGTNVEDNDPLIYKTKTVYNNDGKKIAGSMDDATIQASASSVTANITSVTPTYDTSTSKFNISGSGNITGTISASTKTTGYAVAGTTKDSKTLSGTASLAATLNKISVKATKALCFDDLGQFYTKEVDSNGTSINSHIGSIGTSDSPWKNAFIDDICITDGIRYKDNTSGRTPIILRGFDGDSSGSGVILGNDGCLIISSGESPTNLKSNLNLTGASENTYISSDNSIYFYSNCNTIENKVGLEMNETALMPVVNDTFHLGNTTHRFGWVFCGSIRPGNVALNWDNPSTTADPAIYFRKGSNAATYYTKIVPSNVSANRTLTIPNAGGTLAIASSDIRLKDNIKDTEVENAMETINQIKLHSFDWNDGSHPHQKIGFIADELEEIDDRLAEGEGGYFEDGSMNVKTVDMFYMLGYIVKGMQELDKENKILKEKIEKLENN